MTGSTVKSAARAERMKARWADPAAAERMKANLAKGRLKRNAKAAVEPPPPETPPAGGAAPAAAPFTERRLFGRNRSRSA